MTWPTFIPARGLLDNRRLQMKLKAKTVSKNTHLLSDTIYASINSPKIVEVAKEKGPGIRLSFWGKVRKFFDTS